MLGLSACYVTNKKSLNSARYLIHLVKDGDVSPGDGLTVRFRMLVYLTSDINLRHPHC